MLQFDRMVCSNVRVIIFGISMFFSLGCSFNNETTISNFCINENGERYCCQGQYLQNLECVDCPAGTIGINCTVICPEGYYGPKCRKECKCTGKEKCDHSLGCVSIQTKANTNREWMIFIVIVIIASAVIVLCCHLICQPQSTIFKWMKGSSDEKDKTSVALPIENQPVQNEVIQGEVPYDDVRTSQMTPDYTPLRHSDTHPEANISSYQCLWKLGSMSSKSMDEINPISEEVH